jgi:hypothetical protein
MNSTERDRKLQVRRGLTHSFNFRYVLFLASTAALGGLLFGFDVAIITGAGPFLIR